MATLNERIKEVRKYLGFSQKDFANKIGISQRAVSWSEQSGNNVPDSTIKSICMAFEVNEDWLRTGAEPMRTQPPTFNLDDFVKQRGAEQFELDIVKAYFELEPDLRQHLIQHFKERLYDEAPEPAATEPTVEELEEEYKKSRLNSVQNGDLSASNITAATGTDNAEI